MAAMIVPFLLFGCSGEENIPVKKPEFVIDVPKDPPKNTRNFKGGSSKIQHDPSGMHPGQK
jgi:hypothetical protein